jgi:aspartate/methionine/tyrosine aminotransferase
MDNWSGESQLVRGNVPGFTNMAIGEPFFLEELMRPFYPTLRHSGSDVTYPDSNPIPELEEEIREWLGVPYNYKIVVTCGAKQGLHAVFNHLSAMGYGYVCRDTLYWPSIPSICQAHGIGHGIIPYESDFELVTFPGNPLTFAFPPSGAFRTILDAAYTHPTYGVETKWQKEIVRQYVTSVWSAGKMLGCPGVRVGWIITQDPATASSAARFVEQNTSGVSRADQLFVARTMNAVKPYKEEIQKQANSVLNQNRKIVEGFFEGNVLKQVGDFGMFTVVRSEQAIDKLKRANVLYLSGPAFGDSQYAARLSLGLKTVKIIDVVEKLKEI